MWYFVYLLFECFVFVLCFTKPETPCKVEDVECITKVGKDIIYSLMHDDNKELGVEDLDPMYQELIEGDLPAVKFYLINATIIGFKDIKIGELKVVPPKNLRLDTLMPFIELTGDYKIEGKLFNLPIQGEGKFYINATNIHTIVDATKKLVEKDGKHYLKLTSIQTESDLQGTMYVNLENLFNGNKELADAVLKFINENPKLVANSWQTPLAQANMKKIFKNCNKILATLPLEDLIIRSH